MKKTLGLFGLIFMLIANIFSEEFVRMPIHYSLIGESDGIKVEIVLDNFIPNYGKYLSNPSDPSSPFTKNYLQDNLLSFINSFDFSIVNNSAKNITLSAVLDSLIVATSEYQIEYKLLNTNPEYPQRFIKKAKTKINVPSPYTFATFLSATQDTDKAMAISTILVTFDQLLQSTRLKTVDIKEFQTKIDKLQTWINEKSLLYGDYYILSENIDIPLVFSIFIEEK